MLCKATGAQMTETHGGGQACHTTSTSSLQAGAATSTPRCYLSGSGRAAQPHAGAGPASRGHQCWPELQKLQALQCRAPPGQDPCLLLELQRWGCPTCPPPLAPAAPACRPTDLARSQNLSAVVSSKCRAVPLAGPSRHFGAEATRTTSKIKQTNNQWLPKTKSPLIVVSASLSASSARMKSLLLQTI